MKIKYASDYPQYQAEQVTALRAPQVLPLKGDGRFAGLYNRSPISSRHELTRERLVAARYQEWLESREGFQLTEES